MSKQDNMMAQAFGAVAQEQRIKPAFTVQKLSGEVDHLIHLFDKKENKILSKYVKRSAGYLVTFMRGHSIRAIDDEHLARLGANLRMIPLVDSETGDLKGAIPNALMEA